LATVSLKLGKKVGTGQYERRGKGYSEAVAEAKSVTDAVCGISKATAAAFWKPVLRSGKAKKQWWIEA
jgi:hypothetical protein